MKVAVNIISSMRKILKEEKIEEKEAFIPALAGNEAESFQIILSARERIKAYTVELSPFCNENGKKLDGSVEIFHQKYVHIPTVHPEDEAQGMKPGWYPDALLPYETAVEYGENTISAGENQGVWLTVYANSGATAGIYKATATISLDGEEVAIVLQIKIYDFSLPKEIHYNSNYAIGFETLVAGEGNHFLATYRKYVEKLIKYKLAPFRFLPDPRPSYTTQEEWTNELEYYLDQEEKEGRYISTFSIPVYADGKYVNVERFEMYIEALFLLSLKRKENLFARGAGVHAGFIDEPHLNNTYDLTNSICKHFEEVKAQTAQMLREKYGSDGFKEDMYKEIVGIGNYVTSFFDERLTEIKNWCPSSSQFKDATNRKNYTAKGKSWWYVCNGGVPFALNIDHEPLELRVEGWMRDAYSISGCYYWQTTHYYKWVFEQAVHANIKVAVDCYSEPVRCSTWAGDGFLFYPMKPYNLESPVACIRLDLLRDSVEDYEYLHLLRGLYAKAGKDASAIIEKVQADSFVDLTVKVDDLGYYAQREKIARYIENAQKGIYVE